MPAKRYPVKLDGCQRDADGVVNIQDLVLVAARLGETWEGAEDVNRDGVVNIQDLVLVASQLGEPLN